MQGSIEQIELMIKRVVSEIDYRLQVADLDQAEASARILEHLTASRANLVQVPNA